MVTVAPIAKGEQITASKVARSKKNELKKEGGLAENTPGGKRAVTISVDNINSLAGMLMPGNYVDVIAVVPAAAGQTSVSKQVRQASMMPMFQKVLVLAVGQDIAGGISASAGEEKKRDANQLITLALTPREANFVEFVQEQGKIRLMLRSPSDSSIEPAQLANWDTLLSYVLPQQSSDDQGERNRKATAVPTVEIYRGLNRERVPLGK